MEFNKDDVIKVAREILDGWWWFDDSDNGDGKYHCEYCQGKSEKSFGWDGTGSEGAIEGLKHDLDCPILVARDLLTRAI